MSAYLWVGLGGLIGSMARYAVSVGLGAMPTDRFPWATFAVNFLGCLLIGLLAGFSAKTPLSESARLFLITGILGGFTTFSAFGLESFVLLRRGEVTLAALYIVGSVLMGIGAVWLGFRLTGGVEA